MCISNFTKYASSVLKGARILTREMRKDYRKSRESNWTQD